MGRISVSTSEAQQVTTADDMSIVFLSRSSDWRRNVILWLIRRWCPDYSLAKVLRWPFDGSGVSSTTATGETDG